jgi:hypothetical protein
MTGRRWCSVVAVIIAVAACGDSAASNGGSSADTVPLIVALGPLPTTPTTLPNPTNETIVEPSSTQPAAPPTTPAPITTVAATTSTITTPSTTVRTATKKTACTDVAYIGDSVSLDMISAAALPNGSARLDARLAEIGVSNLQVEISGGRSIVETLSGQENAVDVAVRLRDAGFNGCWIIAVGTNDAANIAAGAARNADQRIAAMMSVIGTDPVLWIDALTVVTTGFWASANVDAWDDALTAANVSYPNVRIARWSKFVRTEWFDSDGIHPTAAGSAARVQFVAAALVANYPKR